MSVNESRQCESAESTERNAIDLTEDDCDLLEPVGVDLTEDMVDLCCESEDEIDEDEIPIQILPDEKRHQQLADDDVDAVDPAVLDQPPKKVRNNITSKGRKRNRHWEEMDETDRKSNQEETKVKVIRKSRCSDQLKKGDLRKNNSIDAGSKKDCSVTLAAHRKSSDVHSKRKQPNGSTIPVWQYTQHGNSKQNSKDSRTERVIHLNNSTVMDIAGKRGKRIRDLMEDTGAYIWVDLNIVKKQRAVYVSGTWKSVALACQMINDMISKVQDSLGQDALACQRKNKMSNNVKRHSNLNHHPAEDKSTEIKSKARHLNTSDTVVETQNSDTNGNKLLKKRKRPMKKDEEGILLENWNEEIVVDSLSSCRAIVKIPYLPKKVNRQYLTKVFHGRSGVLDTSIVNFGGGHRMGLVQFDSGDNAKAAMNLVRQRKFPWSERMSYEKPRCTDDCTKATLVANLPCSTDSCDKPTTTTVGAAMTRATTADFAMQTNISQDRVSRVDAKNDKVNPKEMQNVNPKDVVRRKQQGQREIDRSEIMAEKSSDDFFAGASKTCHKDSCQDEKVATTYSMIRTVSEPVSNERFSESSHSKKSTKDDSSKESIGNTGKQIASDCSGDTRTSGVALPSSNFFSSGIVSKSDNFESNASAFQEAQIDATVEDVNIISDDVDNITRSRTVSVSNSIEILPSTMNLNKTVQKANGRDDESSVRQKEKGDVTIASNLTENSKRLIPEVIEIEDKNEDSSGTKIRSQKQGNHPHANPLDNAKFIILDESESKERSEERNNLSKPKLATKNKDAANHCKRNSFVRNCGGKKINRNTQGSRSSENSSTQYSFVFTKKFHEGDQYNYLFSQKNAQLEQERLFRQAASAARESIQSHPLRPPNNNVPPVFEFPVDDVSKLDENHWRWSDPYSRLGLPPSSSVAAVKKQYRRLALLCHPDKNKAENSANRFQAITEAYQKLSRC